MANFAYDKFVVVAEKEWKLEYGYSFGKGYRTIGFALTIAGIEWQINTTNHSQNSIEDISLVCTSVVERSVDQVHAEIHGYCRMGDSPNYVPGIKCRENNNSMATPLRHVFTRNDNSLHFTATIGTYDDFFVTNILFIVRVLKDRTLLPDFKMEAALVGSLPGSNMRLCVADQTFHVNKELLSAHSKVFDRMFNGEFKEANQAEVELKHERADPALFEDFLLVLCVRDALPNPKNLTGLFKLANIYDAANVREKCERHFRICREMPVEERYMLALEFGNKQMKDSIMNAVDLAESKRIIAALEKHVEFKN